jgi:hypothetical protein
LIRTGADDVVDARDPLRRCDMISLARPGGVRALCDGREANRYIHTRLVLLQLPCRPGSELYLVPPHSNFYSDVKAHYMHILIQLIHSAYRTHPAQRSLSIPLSLASTPPRSETHTDTPLHLQVGLTDVSPAPAIPHILLFPASIPAFGANPVKPLRFEKEGIVPKLPILAPPIDALPAAALPKLPPLIAGIIDPLLFSPFGGLGAAPIPIARCAPPSNGFPSPEEGGRVIDTSGAAVWGIWLIRRLGRSVDRYGPEVASIDGRRVLRIAPDVRRLAVDLGWSRGL